jgi:hypothetical protein
MLRLVSIALALLLAGCAPKSAASTPAPPPARPEPVTAAVAAAPRVLSVAGGSSHTCALRGDRRVTCWGDNSHDQLGPSLVEQRHISPPRRGPWTEATEGQASVVASMHRTCAFGGGQPTRCWGRALEGAATEPTALLAMSDAADVLVTEGGQVRVSGTPLFLSTKAIVQPLTDGSAEFPALPSPRGVAVALFAMAAISADGDLLCTASPKHSGGCPGIVEAGYARVRGLDLVDVAVGATHLCVVRAGGEVGCHGGNEQGQLGVPGTPASESCRESSSSSSFQWPRLPHAARRVVVGQGHSCALLDDRTVWCWGSNVFGQGGGGGGREVLPEPARVAGLVGIRAIAAGADHTCAIDDRDQLWCWGDNGTGQVFPGWRSEVWAPALIPLKP